MKKLIVANWKMNGSFDDVDKWLSSFTNECWKNKEALAQKAEMVLCPPVVFLDYIDSELLDIAFEKLDEEIDVNAKKVEDYSDAELTDFMLKARVLTLGAQDCHSSESGAFTGDVSANMIKNLGTDYVIIGHSERRQGHFETDEMISNKARMVVASGLTPIICVGEDAEIRRNKKHIEFVYKQLLLSIPRDVKFKRLVVAYEPIWSIGTGVVPTAEQIFEMANLIRKILNERGADFAEEIFVLYGGSVSDQNAKDILTIQGVDGLLVGKASLDGAGFVKIASAAL